MAAATDPTVQALACEGLVAPTRVPSGVVAYPVDRLPDELDVDRVTLVDAERSTAQAIASWASARGVELVEHVPTPLGADGVRVVSVSALSTGSGKTATVRRVAKALRASGVSVAVARHPIANLLAWDRFSTTVVRSPDALAAERPLEEREELAPLVGAGIPVAVGLDAQTVLAAAAREAGDGGVLVWDGGGAARPWMQADVDIVVVDLLRPPGPSSTWAQDRVASANAIVLAKADSADEEVARRTETLVRSWNADAAIVLADLAVGVAPSGVLQDRAVVCIEDWSSLALGGLRGGAGTVAARRFRCGMVDPRSFAVGAVRDALSGHDHIGPCIPSLGRTPSEIADLAASVHATPGEVVLWASNADPAFVVPDETRPIVRAFGELTEVSGVSLQTVLGPVIPGNVA